MTTCLLSAVDGPLLSVFAGVLMNYLQSAIQGAKSYLLAVNIMGHLLLVISIRWGIDELLARWDRPIDKLPADETLINYTCYQHDRWNFDKFSCYL